ncbi:MAG TPA: PH domain-containing protein [Solirubrobacteraceae bacterium]
MDPEPGEQIFFHGHPSWRSILGFYVKGIAASVLVGAVVGVITRVSSGKVSVAGVAITVVACCALVLVAGLIKRIQTTYTITNRRLTIDAGILSRELHETRLARVQNVGTKQSLLDRILRVGNVDFDTAAEAGFDFAFRGVSNPHAIVRTVDQAIRELQQSPQL